MGIQAYSSITQRQEFGCNLVTSSDCEFSKLMDTFERMRAIKTIFFECSATPDLCVQTRAEEEILRRRIEIILTKLEHVKIGTIIFSCMNDYDIENHVVKKMSFIANCRGSQARFGELASETRYYFNGALGEYSRSFD